MPKNCSISKLGESTDAESNKWTEVEAEREGAEWDKDAALLDSLWEGEERALKGQELTIVVDAINVDLEFI